MSYVSKRVKLADMKQGLTVFTPVLSSLPNAQTTTKYHFDYRVQEFVLASKPNGGLVKYSTNGNIRTMTTNSLMKNAYVTRRAAQRAADQCRNAKFFIEDNKIKVLPNVRY